MVPKKAQIWIRYRKCRDKATDTQSQGDPKIVKRGPNFEQKGDIFEEEGTKNSNFSELFTKSEYVKMVKKSQFCFEQQADKQLTGLHF